MKKWPPLRAAQWHATVFSVEGCCRGYSTLVHAIRVLQGAEKLSRVKAGNARFKEDRSTVHWLEQISAREVLIHKTKGVNNIILTIATRTTQKHLMLGRVYTDCHVKSLKHTKLSRTSKALVLSQETQWPAPFILVQHHAHHSFCHLIAMQYCTWKKETSASETPYTALAFPSRQIFFHGKSSTAVHVNCAGTGHMYCTGREKGGLSTAWPRHPVCSGAGFCGQPSASTSQKPRVHRPLPQAPRGTLGRDRCPLPREGPALH